MFDSKLANFAAAAYLIMVVVCFGPATVQSENSANEYRAECKKTYGKDALCLSYSSAADGLPKAMAWPLWLSYTIAKGL